MTIYHVLVEPFHVPNGPGQITLKLPAGVAVLTDFDLDAIWLESAKVVQLFYTHAHTAQIEYGLTVDNSLTVAQLKAICTQLGLSTSGLKADLLARVQEATS